MEVTTARARSRAGKRMDASSIELSIAAVALLRGISNVFRRPSVPPVRGLLDAPVSHLARPRFPPRCRCRCISASSVVEGSPRPCAFHGPGRKGVGRSVG